MAALIALEFRLLWKSSRAGLPYVAFIVPVFLSSLWSSENTRMESLAPFLVIPALLLTVSGLVSIQNAEKLAWLAPLKRLARIHARLWLFSVLASLHVAVIFAFYLVMGSRPVEPWGLLAVHLWLCFLGTGLLLFALAHMTRSQHAFLQTLAFIVGVAPGFGMSAGHVVSGAPLWTLGMEAGIVFMLLVFNFLLHLEMEPVSRLPNVEAAETPRLDRAPATSESGSIAAPEPLPFPPRRAPTSLPVPAVPRLDHVADPGPVLVGSLFAYVSVWLGIGGCIAGSFVPVPLFYLITEFLLLQMIVIRVFQHWAPFQWTAIPRQTVLRRVFIPILLLWAITLGIQGATILYDRPSVLNYSVDGFSLPFFKRDFVVYLPAPFQSSGSSRDRELPASAREVAVLMSQALHTGYGIAIPQEEILAMRPSETTDSVPGQVRSAWLRDVEQRWESPIRLRLLQWRIAAGLFALLMLLTSVSTTLRGRMSRWANRLLQWVFTPLFLWPLFSPFYSRVVPLIPARLRVLYGEVFDRPWILIALLLPAVSLLLIRHAVVFCVSPVDLSHLKRRSNAMLDSMV
jgi:hypothetical protein